MSDRRRRVLWLAPALLMVAALLRAQVQLPNGATTDCQPHGGSYSVQQHVELVDIESGRERYGPCFGGNWQLAGCDDNQVGPTGAKRCITTEAERQQVIAWYEWQQIGCTAEPGETWSFPSEEAIEDAGLVLGMAAQMQRDRIATCGGVAPTPTPTPTPEPTPEPTPAPDPTPTPQPPAPQCVPQPVPAVILEALRAIPDKGQVRVTWQLPALRDRALEALAAYDPCPAPPAP
jgi:hypothetical protein